MGHAVIVHRAIRAEHQPVTDGLAEERRVHLLQGVPPPDLPRPRRGVDVHHRHVRIAAALAVGPHLPHGIAHLAETLAAVNADRTGKVILTIEPHLMDFTGLASLAAETLKHKYIFETPFDAFRTAAESVMRMAESLE